jgi:hypothetical protein
MAWRRRSVVGKTADTTAQAPPPAEPAPVEFKVTGLELGKQVDMDKRVVSPTTTFGAGTRSTCPGHRGLDAQRHAVRQVDVRRPGTDGQRDERDHRAHRTGGHEFHITKASKWPSGKYKVEVSVNGTPAATKEFEVTS